MVSEKQTCWKIDIAHKMHPDDDDGQYVTYLIQIWKLFGIRLKKSSDVLQNCHFRPAINVC